MFFVKATEYLKFKEIHISKYIAVFSSGHQGAGFQDIMGLLTLSRPNQYFLELGICSISAILESYNWFRNFYTLKK